MSSQAHADVSVDALGVSCVCQRPILRSEHSSVSLNSKNGFGGSSHSFSSSGKAGKEAYARSMVNQTFIVRKISPGVPQRT